MSCPGDVFYSWDAHNHSGDRGVCGIAKSQAQATAQLSQALADLAQGATGIIRLTSLDRLAGAYNYGRVIMRARHDESGVVLVGGG
ncbi:hypothetical protein ACFOY2_12585 [Nonomuraea purpurea]|uniref:Uncharacterized protein n=1 Tax=Nonomuraea purpurea TaxID=1849276 RepID=A0ABV8G5Y7_9ACTN